MTVKHDKFYKGLLTQYNSKLHFRSTLPFLCLVNVIHNLRVRKCFDNNVTEHYNMNVYKIPETF